MKRTNEARWIESRNRWQINVQSDGIRRTFASSTPGRKGKIECEKKADEWLDSRLTNETTRTDRVLDMWLDEVKKMTGISYWRTQESIVRVWIKPEIGHKKIGSVTENDLQSIINNAYRNGNNGEGMSDRMLRSIRSSIASFMKFCRGIPCSRLIPEHLTIPRGAKASVKTIASKDDLKTLFSVTTTTYYGKRVEDFYVHAYRFAVVTGLRPGELIGLQNRKISNGIMTIDQSINDIGEVTSGKNKNARRSQVLSDAALKVLQDQSAMLKRMGIISKYVFPEKDGGCISQHNFRDYWKRYRIANGLSGAPTPYELRHTFVSIVDEMPTALKKMVVGHSRSMDTEGVYSHEKRGDKERSAKYIDAAIKNVLQ